MSESEAVSTSKVQGGGPVKQSRQELVDQVVEKIIELRDERTRIKQEYEEQDKELKRQVEKGENWLLKYLNDQGLDKFSTTSGTVFTTEQVQVNATDWPAFHEYIGRTGRLDLLQKRPATTNIRQVVDEEGEVPPGVELRTEIKVNVRRK